MIQALQKLEAEGNLRSLKDVSTLQKYIYFENKQYLNFSTNDYLGLCSISLQQEFFKTIDLNSEFLMSNPSSRLMTGNNSYYTELEESLANLFRKESALVLSSGYILNSGILPALTNENDFIVADKLVHASIIDGLRLCKCKWTRFRHNDMDNLRSILEKTQVKGTIYIVTESIFSMDGDIAPLGELVDIKNQFSAKLYVDEAHAFGVRGANGCGVAEELGLLSEIDYLVATFGKALASQGGFVTCDSLSRELLINRMRTLIFSTALPSISLLWSRFLVERLPSFTTLREKLAHNISYFTSALSAEGITLPEVKTHILPLIIGENNATLNIAENLKKEGVWVSAIRYPTVPKGASRLRFSITASFEEKDLLFTAQSIKSNML